MKTKLIILTITVLALTSCRKYEEGGKYFLANMSKKIAGTYHFTHYYIDGVDSVDYYFNNEYTAELDLHYNQERDERVGYFTYEHNNDVYKNFGLRVYCDGMFCHGDSICLYDLPFAFQRCRNL